MNKPAIAVDRRGGVLDINPEAAALFDDDLQILNGRLIVRDREAQRSLDVLFEKLLVANDTDALTADPILVRRARKTPVVVRLLSIPGPTRSPGLRARVLLTFSALEPTPRPNVGLLMHAFNLSRAEARLASIIATGTSVQQAAEQLGIARHTARNQLKAVFAKTGTHRQGELIALLAKL